MEAMRPEVLGRDATTTAAALSDLAAAGQVFGLARVQLVVVKGSRKAIAAAIRDDRLLLVLVDPATGTGPVEKVLLGWASPGEAAAAPLSGAQAPGGALIPSPAPATAAPAVTPAASPATRPPAAAPASSPLSLTLSSQGAGKGRGSLHSTAAAPPPSVTADTGPAQEAQRSSRLDAWAALRRSLVRGQLTEAAARRRELCETTPGGAARPGAEPLAELERDRAVQTLLEGIGSVLAGDAVGGSRTLGELTAPSQRNLSLRWLALHWSARAALRSGGFNAARSHVKTALAIAQQLDLNARAVTQWIAGEVLALDGDPRRALVWVTEARTRFEQLGERWGLGQTWLAEARILATLHREQEAIEAARRARATDEGWEDPLIFLAQRAVITDDLAQAESILTSLQSPSADRVRALIRAVQQGAVKSTDAAEFLRESEAPPTERAIRALERIANAAPGFVQAREALAWMSLRSGKYADASAMFRGLLAEQLSPADRASVMLGMGCIAHAQQTSRDPGTSLRTPVSANGSAQPANGNSGVEPQELSSSSLSARKSSIDKDGPTPVFSGQLSAFALPDVLEFLRGARRTGVFVCSSSVGMGALHFRDGGITGAAAPGTPSLGDLLVESRKLSSAALRTLAAAQGGDLPDPVLGRILVREGLVDTPALQDVFRRKIELCIRELVQWKEGVFAFNPGGDGESAPPELSVAVDVQEVLLNVFKELDEGSRAQPGSFAEP